MTNKIDEDLDNMSTKDLMHTLDDVLTHPDYEESSYTKSMKDIMEKYRVRKKLTSGQESFVRTHLKYNTKLWY